MTKSKIKSDNKIVTLNEGRKIPLPKIESDKKESTKNTQSGKE